MASYKQLLRAGMVHLAAVVGALVDKATMGVVAEVVTHPKFDAFVVSNLLEDVVATRQHVRMFWRH